MDFDFDELPFPDDSFFDPSLQPPEPQVDSEPSNRLQEFDESAALTSFLTRPITPEPEPAPAEPQPVRRTQASTSFPEPAPRPSAPKAPRVTCNIRVLQDEKKITAELKESPSARLSTIMNRDDPSSHPRGWMEDYLSKMGAELPGEMLTYCSTAGLFAAVGMKPHKTAISMWEKSRQTFYNRINRLAKERRDAEDKELATYANEIEGMLDEPVVQEEQSCPNPESSSSAIQKSQSDHLINSNSSTLTAATTAAENGPSTSSSVQPSSSRSDEVDGSRTEFPTSVVAASSTEGSVRTDASSNAGSSGSRITASGSSSESEMRESCHVISITQKMSGLKIQKFQFPDEQQNKTDTFHKIRKTILDLEPSDDEEEPASPLTVSMIVSNSTDPLPEPSLSSASAEPTSEPVAKRVKRGPTLLKPPSSKAGPSKEPSSAPPNSKAKSDSPIATSSSAESRDSRRLSGSQSEFQTPKLDSVLERSTGSSSEEKSTSSRPQRKEAKRKSAAPSSPEKPKSSTKNTKKAKTTKSTTKQPVRSSGRSAKRQRSPSDSDAPQNEEHVPISASNGSVLFASSKSKSAALFISSRKKNVTTPQPPDLPPAENVHEPEPRAERSPAVSTPIKQPPTTERVQENRGKGTDFKLEKQESRESSLAPKPVAKSSSITQMSLMLLGRRGPGAPPISLPSREQSIPPSPMPSSRASAVRSPQRKMPREDSVISEISVSSQRSGMTSPQRKTLRGDSIMSESSVSSQHLEREAKERQRKGET